MKCNFKFFGMFFVLSIFVVSMFGICSFAKTGNYATLYGHYYYNGSDGRDYAYANVTNNTSTKRYISASLKNENNNVIIGRENNISAKKMLGIPDTDVTSYNTVIAHCTVYNSATPSSGTAETLSEYVK